MLIVKRIAVKLFQQVEGNVRFVFQQSVADDAQVVVNADRVNVVADLFEGRDHVPLSFERRNFFRGEIVDAFRRHQIFVTKHDHAQFLEGLAVFARQ